MDTNTTNDTAKKFDRSAIREAVLNQKVEDKIVDAFGVKIAVRPPTLKGMIVYQGLEQDEFMLAKAVAYNCYVPDTGELVFEESDLEAIANQQFGPDMKKLNAAIQDVLSTDKAVAAQIEDNTKSPAE